ncbi:hypothetical protein [Haliea sp.]|uniref:hypothetical protein n=1 Tax=Haliea sp. TaxID=1932666 RepID=UPI0025BAC50B|nr:hypothetical protein [Haliea sp.]|tara:strand:+ start:349 stop:564 length:216 start_codon:yes stop_codon:yes gene_type:complete
MDWFVTYLVALITGICLSGIYYDNKDIVPYEDHLEEYCVKIGSELKTYTVSGELTCKNGAKFEYDITGDRV